MSDARLATAGVLLASLAACGSPGSQAAPSGQASQPITHRVLATGQQCGRPQPHLAQVTDLAQLRHLVDGDSLPARPAPPRPDLARETVLWLGMGELRSSGGQVTVTRVEVTPAAGQLVLHTQWTLPEPGHLHAMVVTRPCVVVALPGAAYRTVRVLDAEGRERLSADLPERP